LLAIAARKGANVTVAGAWSNRDGAVKCPVCAAEYILGQQMPFGEQLPFTSRKNAIWPRMTQELIDLLARDHEKDRQHLDKVEFDV
jgi:hypothetical protein